MRSWINAPDVTRLAGLHFLLLSLLLGGAFLPSVGLGQTGDEREAGLDAGSPMTPEQAAIDVLRYDLELEVFPDEQRIAGSVAIRAKVKAPLAHAVFDLNERLRVTAVTTKSGAELAFQQAKGRLRITLKEELPVDSMLELRIAYGGVPRVAPNPPWDGGFTWSETADGSPWIGTSCQTNGADLWWPCKDHPSDEPLGMTIAITVPDPLICASNGRLKARKKLEGERTQFVWEVSTPINTYCVALAIAPYVILERNYQSIAGEEVPVQFFALPESKGRAETFLDQIVLRDLAWFEKTFGPYPFRADKYGVAETPFLGMEHQTIIAYGNRYQVRRGYDWLHHHELAHEWWGNLVSVADWSDFWIHEGIGTYCQALFLGDLRGEAAYRAEIARIRRQLVNRHPIAPRESKAAREVYLAEAGNDIYYKGSCVMNALCGVIGKDKVVQGLSRFLYPTEAARRAIDGSACRSVTTAELIQTFETVAEMPLDWFFEVYLREAALPRLVEERTETQLLLRWVAPGDRRFPMPVEVKVGDILHCVAMENGEGVLAVDAGVEVQIDPSGWLLRGR